MSRPYPSTRTAGLWLIGGRPVPPISPKEGVGPTQRPVSIPYWGEAGRRRPRERIYIHTPALPVKAHGKSRGSVCVQRLILPYDEVCEPQLTLLVLAGVAGVIACGPRVEAYPRKPLQPGTSKNTSEGESDPCWIAVAFAMFF